MEIRLQLDGYWGWPPVPKNSKTNKKRTRKSKSTFIVNQIFTSFRFMTEPLRNLTKTKKREEPTVPRGRNFQFFFDQL